MSIAVRLANISGYPNYMVTSDGRVFSKSRYAKAKLGSERWVTGRWPSLTLQGRGYLQVQLGLKTHKLVHRLVAEAFVPNPDQLPQVNHKDGNKLNNNADNLEWCTARDNTRHGFATGLITPNGKGHNSRSAKLTLKQFNEIKELLAKGLTQKEIAKRYNIHQSTVSNMVRGKSWVQ